MKAKKYFDKEYGNDHIKSVVDLKDLESLYGLIQEYADEQLRLHIVSQQRDSTDYIRQQAQQMDETVWICAVPNLKQ